MNAGGRSYYFRTQAEAIQAATLPGGQLRSGDLGCMQINTRWHGQRFRDAGHMLDPRTNVLYAGWYLRTLYLQHGSWHEAVARYHSSQGVHQRAYLCRVVSVRMRLGMQTPNRWFAQTCPGGMQTYLAWARFQR
jgi:soluble lytic murein transglycosylase-like protein